MSRRKRRPTPTRVTSEELLMADRNVQARALQQIALLGRKHISEHGRFKVGGRYPVDWGPTIQEISKLHLGHEQPMAV